MKQSQIDEIARNIALDEGNKLVEEIKSLGSKIKTEEVIGAVAAQIPVISMRTTVEIIKQLGLVQIDPEDAD